MIRRILRAFFSEISYLADTFSWIFSNLKTKKGAKLVYRTFLAYSLAVIIITARGFSWYFRTLANPRRRRKLLNETFIIGAVVFLFFIGGIFLWAATLQIPDLNSFDHKLISQSTKIFDRTGNVLLYDLGGDVRRTVVTFDQISPNMKKATLAIEDAEFYHHGAIRPTSIIRALWINFTRLGFHQGGSTITQQVIKNSLLNNSKSVTRKIKEWILAIKLEQEADKNSILNLYLNIVPYGGNIYGVEEASEAYYGVHAIDLTIGQSAYLAALTQAPSHYSPYGSHRDELESRKTLVLSKMLQNKLITEAEYASATAEKVAFTSQPANSIKAPHFVMYTVQYLEDKYGNDIVQNNSLRVITTVDYPMQQKAEEIVKNYVDSNENSLKAHNASLVAADPKTGQILTMVGSRDYFSKTIDGNFNVATAHRQPGSSFKPFVYATAFNKGYTPKTILFDLDTEFNVNCTPDHVPTTPSSVCYDPQNYEGGFKGPMTIRDALAQSRNIPGVKALYLAGIQSSIDTAHAMGIQSLNAGAGNYGLTLVLGGGEVTPLDMAEAYSVFANNGLRNPATGILSITDRDGHVLEEYATTTPEQALPEQSALEINDILSDNQARAPIFGSRYFGDQHVAMKTGTTNNSRDAWIIGYTPDIAVSAWMGNNDNSPMIQKASAVIVAPMWKKFMDFVLPKYSQNEFKPPAPLDETNMKPVLRGIWQGNVAYTQDKTTGLLATDATPPEMRQDVYTNNVHEILYYVNKNDPQGPAPTNPASDPQFRNWESSVANWAGSNGLSSALDGTLGTSTVPTTYDNAHTPEAAPKISITSPVSGSSYPRNQPISVNISTQGSFSLAKVDYFVNGSFVGSANKSPFTFSFVPNDVAGISSHNEIRAVGYDSVLNKGEAVVSFDINP